LKILRREGGEFFKSLKLEPQLVQTYVHDGVFVSFVGPLTADDDALFWTMGNVDLWNISTIACSPMDGSAQDGVTRLRITESCLRKFRCLLVLMEVGERVRGLSGSTSGEKVGDTGTS